jgi:predicted nicotinamide N-methyase
MAALIGARASVISDYGTDADPSLVKAIDLNIAAVAPYLTPPPPVISTTDTIANTNDTADASTIILNNSECTGGDIRSDSADGISKRESSRLSSPSATTTTPTPVGVQPVVPPVLAGVGYVWGYPVKPLTDPIGGGKFDVIFLADLIFNRSVRLGGVLLSQLQ